MDPMNQMNQPQQPVQPPVQMEEKPKSKKGLLIVIVLVVVVALVVFLLKDKLFSNSSTNTNEPTNTTTDKTNTNDNSIVFDKLIVDGVEFNLATINEELEEKGWIINTETSDELIVGNMCETDYQSEKYGKGRDKFRIIVIYNNIDPNITKHSESRLDGLLVYTTKTVNREKVFLESYPTIEFNGTGDLTKMTYDEFKKKYTPESEDKDWDDDTKALHYLGNDNTAYSSFGLYFDKKTDKFTGINLTFKK